MPGPFLCSECPYQTQNSYDLTKHGLYHSKTKNYPCPTCSKLFTTASDLKRHERTHEADRQLQCSFQNCSFVTHRSDSLVLHEKTHTGIESRLNHPCVKCEKMFSSSQIAARHLKTCGQTKLVKDKSVKETLCQLCKKEFSSVYKLKTHLKIHEGKLDFQCNTCLKMFASRFALNKHNLIHEKKFQCEICEKIFSRKDNLQIHIQTHFLAKNTVDASSNMMVEYICSFCNKPFRSKEDLVTHFKTDLSCNKNCQEQLYQEVTEYHDVADHISTNQHQINSEIILTQVVEADSTPSEVFAEIILVDDDANQEVLIIEEPVVYI